MTNRVADDYTGVVGPVPDAAALSADLIVGTPDYVATGGHGGLGTAVEFAPEEYVTYLLDFGSSDSARIWVTTPAAMDGVGQDWTVFELIDGAGNPLARAGWNPNRRWKLYDVATATSTTGSAGTAAATSTQYGMIFEYELDTPEPFMTLRIHNADDTERVELYASIDIDNPPVGLRVGNRQPSDAAIVLSDFAEADDPLSIGDPPPATLGLIGARVGNASPTGFQVVTYTGSDVDQVRLVVRDVATHTLVTTTTALFPDSRGYAKHTVAGLAAETAYEYRVDGYDEATETWALLDNPWTGSDYLAPVWTFPAEDQDDYAFRLALEACSQKKPERDTYDKIRAREPRLTFGVGDHVYDNRTDTATPPHFDAWERGWAIDNGKAELNAQVVDVKGRSDHDGGEGGNAGAGELGTVYALAAIKTMLPTAELLAPNTMGQWFRHGRDTFIVPDGRSQFRTAHDAPSGSRSLYGTVQLAAIIAKIHEAGQRGDLIHFVSDMIMTGTRETLLSASPEKKDAGPVYESDYFAVCAALAYYPTQHIIYGGDYHALGLIHAHPLTGGPYVQFAGAVTQFGNMRNPEDYDEVFNPAAGSRGNVFFDIDVEHVGDDVTITVHGWDARADDEVITAEYTFDLSSPPPLPETPPTQTEFLFDGVDVSNLAKGIEQVAPGVLAMRGENAVIPYGDGRQWNAFKSYDETDITFLMHAVGATEDGEMPLGFDEQMALCRANLDQLTRIFSSPNLVEIRKRFGDEYRIIYGQVVSAVSFSIFSPRLAKFAVTFRCPHPFWRSETLVSQELPYDFPSVGNLWFTDFAGSTARSQRMLIEAYGQLEEPKFSGTDTPPGVLNYFRYRGSVQPSKRITVDIAAGTIIKDTPDDPEDPPADEIELLEKFEGGPLLTLHPRTKDEADGAYGLRVNVAEPPGVGALIRMTGYRWYVLHG